MIAIAVISRHGESFRAWARLCTLSGGFRSLSLSSGKEESEQDMIETCVTFAKSNGADGVEITAGFYEHPAPSRRFNEVILNTRF